jgi:hypothetical protein
LVNCVGRNFVAPNNDALIAINDSARTRETEYRKKSGDYKEPVQSENSDGTKQDTDKRIPMPFRVEVESLKGEYVSSLGSQLLELTNLPPDIKCIRFDNTNWCQSINKYVPMRQFHIVLDFESGKALDLGRSAARKTENKSNVNIWGIDQVWVNGTSKTILDILQKRKTFSRFIHEGYIYDCLLWLILFPIFAIDLYRWDPWLRKTFPTNSGAFFGFLYVACAFYFLIVFKLIFDYARWLFPFLTLREFPRHLQAAHRSILGVIILGVLSSLMAAFIWGH